MRINTTTLESFRLFMQPEQEWMSEDELIATIKGQFVPNHNVIVGMAFDAILEHPDYYRVVGGYEYRDQRSSETLRFSDEVVQPCLEVFDPSGVRQVKATKRYGDCTVAAVADQLVGARVVENKTILSTFDFDKYAKGCQWRFYLDIFRAVAATYNVFCLSEPTDGVFSLRGIESFNLFDYPDLQPDLYRLVEDFVVYVKYRKLDGLLHERQARADRDGDVMASRVRPVAGARGTDHAV